MRMRHLFLLVYLWASCRRTSSAQSNAACAVQDACAQVPDPTSRFLHCVGLPPSDTGRDHMLRLKGIIDAALDVYTFMRSSVAGVPVLELDTGMEFNPGAEAFQDQALVQMWLKVKIRPLLRSVTRHFLSCLSTKNFSCSTYRTVVQELSLHYSEMDPVRQKWIYTFFMYPFLSKEGAAGCVRPDESSEEWLMRNFGAFKALARMEDFSTLNMVFSGLEVLHLLSPEQKAELLLRPEVAGLDNGTLSLVFQSMMTGGQGPRPTITPGGNWTTPGYPYTHPSPRPTYDPYSPPTPQGGLREVVNGFMGVFRPVGSFFKEFVSLAHQKDVSKLTSATLTQALLNWTLAELANIYRPPQNISFDVTDVENWYHQVVMPLLRRFLPHDQNQIPDNIKAAFHRVFFLDMGMGNDTVELPDSCSIIIEDKACGLTNAVENVARVLHCVARSNLTMSQETILRMVLELTGRLNSLVKGFSKANFSEVASQFREVFAQVDSPSLTKENLEDPAFIRLWFNIKLLPLLPAVPTSLLSCLSTKNFTCPVYQALVAELSEHMRLMDVAQMHSHMIYQHLIYPFLLHHNTSDPHCVSSANHSAEWLEENFGFFSPFASIRDFHDLNPNFSGLEVLELLSPKQRAELVVFPLPAPPEKDVIINGVFDFLLGSPEERGLPEFLQHLVRLSEEMRMPCSSYLLIFKRLDQAKYSVPSEMQPVIWASIDDLTQTAPEDCRPTPKCPSIPLNETKVCAGINSDVLQHHLQMGNTTDVPCDFSLEQYACLELKNFTASHLVSLLMCKLPGNSSYSRETWKVLLTKLSSVLDQALDMLSNMTMPMIGPSATEILDVIGEIRIFELSDEQLKDSDVINQWFSMRLRGFLPSASGGFLQCLSSSNLSCYSYQHILMEFSHQFHYMNQKAREMVVEYFIQPFLTKNMSNPGCVSGFNSSEDWLRRNLGPFSVFLSLRELLDLNPGFSPLEVLELLSSKQRAELVVLPLPAPPEKDVIINRVFDFLLESPVERGLPEFLRDLVKLSAKMRMPCSSYLLILKRLEQATTSVPPKIEPVIWASIDGLMQTAPKGCKPKPKCLSIPLDETKVCVGDISYVLQHHLQLGDTTDVPCHFSLEQYACAELKNFTASHLVSLLMCKLPGNSSYSRETWKVLLTKLSSVLDQALDMLANMSKPMIGPSASEILDVIGEMRVLMLTDEQLRDVDVIHLWFSMRLRGFLSSASGGFLHCLSSRNLSCQSYQHILMEFSHQFHYMDFETREMVFENFIQPFLTKNMSNPGCVSGFNSSEDWLRRNLGPFSVFFSLRELLDLNPGFSPLEVLELLSPKQRAELLVLPLPEKDVIIQGVFDFLLESPEKRELPEFLLYLVRFTDEVRLPCGDYKLIFDRLYKAIPSVPPKIEPFIWASIDDLIQSAPGDCLPDGVKCQLVPFNDSRICNGINSTTLQHYLDSSTSMNVPCSFTLEEYACAELKNFTASHLVSLLMCKLPGNSSYSRETWRLLLTKLSSVLDQALDMLANKSMTMIGPSASDVLDVIGEMRVSTLSDEQLRDSDVISRWFSERLRGFLPFASGGFLHCLSGRNLSCRSYQHILREFSHHYDHMDHMRRDRVVKYFIHPFLSKNTSDPGCVSSANSSESWLRRNFGPFSSLLSVKDLLHLNPGFAPLEVLELLSPKQRAELLVLPLPDKDVIIHTVFDYLTKAPKKRGLPEFLRHLVRFSEELNISCPVYQSIFGRLYHSMSVLPREMEPIIWAAVYNLTESAPMGCPLVPIDPHCPTSSHNASRVCAGVDSSTLQHILDTKNWTAMMCDFSITHYACSQLEGLTAEHLSMLLKCKLPESATYPRETWKLFFTKSSAVLDQALDILSNESMNITGPSVADALDVIGEMRVSMLSADQLRDNDVIRKWFSGRLRGFLSSASSEFLRCLSSKNLSCHSYQLVLKEFVKQFDHMTSQQQNMVLMKLILPFLSRPQTDPGCVSSTNSSREWLQSNFGPFSVLLPVRRLLDLNPGFAPLEVLDLLSPKQTAELMVLPPPEKDDIINKVFDYLTESPRERGLSEFLQHLVRFSAEGNISCSSYQTIFARLDLVIPTVPVDIESIISSSKITLLQHLPPGCVMFSGQCDVTPINETLICAGVNSSRLQHRLDNGQLSGAVCSFGIEEYACASLSALTAEDLATVLPCKRPSNSSGSRAVWKLFLSKASGVLNAALDLLAKKTLDPSDPAVPLALDAIGEIRLDTFSEVNLQDPAFIKLWFSQRLHPFLPAVSKVFLSCLSTKNFSCSTYQLLVQILSRHQSAMDLPRQVSVFTNFIEVFLTRNNTAEPSCSAGTLNSGDWLDKNFRRFSALVSFSDMQRLYSKFSAFEALPQLTVRQLAEVSSTPGQLTSSSQVTTVMDHVPNQYLTAFFNNFSPAIKGHESQFPVMVRSAMLQVVFDRANLSDASTSDPEVLAWLHNRLQPLLVGLTSNHVAPFFSVVAGRNCSTQQQAVEVLNSTLSTLHAATQTEIHDHIIQSLRGLTPLRCYGNDYSVSYYGFLERSFMGFQFPKLTTFLSLMPGNKMHQLVNSMPPSHLGSFLRRTSVVDNDTQLCQLYSNYDRTPVFLETETLPEAVRRPTLPCVWPMALSSSGRSEVNAWFDRRLPNYLVFLDKSLLDSTATHNATCFAFQKLVSVLSIHNYSTADFGKQDVFYIIRAYLASATVPKCYNAGDPEMNSTAWFAEYMGSFMVYLTLEDLLTFGSSQVLQLFTVNPLNIALLHQFLLPQNLTSYYTELLFLQDSNFNPTLLPVRYQCDAPGPAFSQLNAAASVTILDNLTKICTDLDPQVSAALAGNLGTDHITAESITALGNQSSGMSTGQLTSAPPGVLHASLHILSKVLGWNRGQAMAIIHSLMSSGMLQINDASSLFLLGSLVTGVPVATFSNISGSQLLLASQNPLFLTNVMTASQIVQQTFVTQIISVNSNSESIIQNVPDDMAIQIPRSLLQGFTMTSVTRLNKKKWKREQAVLFFGTVAVGFDNQEDKISSQVLQGFTCTRVTTLSVVKVRRLVRACRRRGRRKVLLLETQLTCMYYYIKSSADVTSFSLLPPDLLLYYDYSLVPQSSCRSYFTELGDADFSVVSQVLRYKLTTVFDNARSCLGITGTNLTQDNVSVLGNMCCILDGSYIQNSDPSILEKLKNCPDFTVAQVAAMETLLVSGTTQYGVTSTWNRQTLNDLGMLPLYLTENFYSHLKKKTKRKFLRSFLKVLRRNKVKRRKIKRMKKAIKRSNRRVYKRAIMSECTVGAITQVTIHDDAFPFDYDTIDQFDACLDNNTVKQNLAAITDKVDDEEYLDAVRRKLREAYPNSTIPEGQVQLLGPASRDASGEDILVWDITTIDTLSALMDPSDGEWNPATAKAIITKYLSVAGNSLGSAELNSIGGANLCALDTSVLKTITQDSLRNANEPTLSSCTLEKKRELFTIAERAFSGDGDTRTTSTVTTTEYQLMTPYLGGATLDYVQRLAASNISMDLDTLTSLDENVTLALSVDEMRNLLGEGNLPELKSYENQPVVASWISSRLQTDLDSLNIGLTGGIRTNATTTSSSVTGGVASTPSSTGSSNTTASGSGTTGASGSGTTGASGSGTTGASGSGTTGASGSGTTGASGSGTTGASGSGTTTASGSGTTTASGSGTTASGSATTTGSGGARFRPDAGLSLLVLLILFITSQHILL